MELFQLASFLRVADEGSVTRAAEGLSLTQPAVTRHVRALERELGVALFERTDRGMRLTPVGSVLRDYVRRSLGLLDEARQQIADVEAGLTGSLVLGAGVTTSIFHLPDWLRAFRETHPAVEVAVRTGRSREIAQMALAREIDLGFVTSPARRAELEETPLFEEEIVLVAPGPGEGTGTLTALRFAESPLILFSRGSGFREYLDRAFARTGLAPLVKMESDSVEAIKSFVAVGLGLSFLPGTAVAEEIAAGSLFRIAVEGLPPLRRATSVIRRTDRYLGAGARAFLSMLLTRLPQDESR